MADDGKFGWFVAGASIGAAIALLYAPKSGRETRQLIADTTEQGREVLTETSQDIVERGRALYDRGKQIADEAAELFERGRKLVGG